MPISYGRSLFLGAMASATIIAGPAASSSPELDVTTSVSFEDIRQCILAPDLEAALRAGPTGTGIMLRNRQTVTAEVRTTGNEDDGTTETSTLRLPQGARWNDLSITRVESELYLRPEADSAHTRRMHFRATPSEVRQTFARFGVSVPQAPEYRALEDGICGGAMMVEPVAGGATLTCTWGC